MSKKSNFTDGFTIIEVIISVFILSLIVVSAATFQRDVFSLNFFLQGSLNAQLDARHVVKIMVAELRKASPSALGAYPIALASSTAITFYSDGVKDRVRYLLGPILAEMPPCLIGNYRVFYTLRHEIHR